MFDAQYRFNLAIEYSSLYALFLAHVGDDEAILEELERIEFFLKNKELAN